MPRRPRHDHAGSWYHVMNRGVDRRAIFFDDSDRVDFGRQLGLGFERFGVEVHAYCLMTNHYHLLLRCPDGGLSRYMRDVFATFTRHVNDRHARDGPLFRGRFHSKPVESDAYVLCATRYIHRNAIDLPGVTSFDQYRWSSHRTYLGHRRRPPWMRTDIVLGMLDDDVTRFGEFVAGHQFVPPGHELTPHDLHGLIGLVIDEQIGLNERDHAAACRTVTMLAHSSAPTSRMSLLDPLLPTSDGAYRTALSRARRAADEDPRLSDLASQIVRMAA